ncbi:hypothetical protein GCM10007036_31840 [Alsobacter metallidurans]|uniref:Branched-chain amino acid transport n=1 Tax=Alsobacter metallidurans TaxID=340221 RepID=A0A917MJ66_9HYPH|nr:AzlD domain-containing protein [Alsobacter metallidurans]GGH25021.1 hypothetical protein GCM10007036_31840 [Alsobacter metallidurans]
MTLDLAFVHGPLWPYIMIILCGLLPTEVWRILGVAAARGVPEGSLFLVWVRAVSTALLAAVVAKLLLSPSGALALVPWWGRTGAIVIGFACFFAFRRSFFAGIVIGEAALIAAATWWGG